MRIATLTALGNDIVATLGLSEQLVGVSHDCLQKQYRLLPRLTHVSENTRTINQAQLLALEPNVVIADEDTLLSGVLLPPYSKLVRLNAQRLEDIPNDLERVGAATGKLDLAALLGQHFKARLSELQTHMGAFDRPSVLLLDQAKHTPMLRPWFGQVCALAGIRPSYGRLQHASGRVVWLSEPNLNPDVVVVLSSRQDELALVALELARWAERSGLQQVGAYHNAQAWVMDAHVLLGCVPSVLRGVQVLGAITRHAGVMGVPLTPSEAVRFGAMGLMPNDKTPSAVYLG